MKDFTRAQLEKNCWTKDVLKSVSEGYKKIGTAQLIQVLFLVCSIESLLHCLINMEETTGFRLTNDYGVVITVSLEPEGTIFELQPGDTVQVSISPNLYPAMDLQVNKDESGFYFSLWSEKGEYRLFSQGQEVI